jgi:hypothetical protein
MASSDFDELSRVAERMPVLLCLNSDSIVKEPCLPHPGIMGCAGTKIIIRPYRVLLCFIVWIRPFAPPLPTDNAASATRFLSPLRETLVPKKNRTWDQAGQPGTTRDNAGRSGTSVPKGRVISARGMTAPAPVASVCDRRPAFANFGHGGGAPAPLGIGLDLKCMDGITFRLGFLDLGLFQSLCERKAPDRRENHAPPAAICQENFPQTPHRAKADSPGQ